MHLLSFLFLGLGVLSSVASLAGWKWFFESENASFFVKYLGRKGARWLYGTIGMALITAGVLLQCDLR